MHNLTNETLEGEINIPQEKVELISTIAWKLTLAICSGATYTLLPI